MTDPGTPNRWFVKIGLLIGLFTLPLFIFAQKDLNPDRKEIGVALVIGNQAYEHATRLTSPVNDAEDMSAVLRRLGFKVLKARKDASLREMEDAIAEFEKELTENGGVGVFYYSGHGVQSRGANYLIPVDAYVPAEGFLRDKTLNVATVIASMEDATKSSRIVILDACRNNPFEKTWRVKGGSVKGLAQVTAPRGTLIAYATSPGDVAADGSGRNSPYTEILLQEIVKPNTTIGEMFQEVRYRLNTTSRGDQVPWESTSLTGRFCFAGCAAGTRSKTSEAAYWEAIENSAEISDFEDYLRRCKNREFVCVYRATAELKLDRLKKAAHLNAWLKFKETAKGLLKYFDVEDFSEDRAVVALNGKNGYINKSGQLIIPLNYETAYSFSEGTASVEDENGNWNHIDKSGKTFLTLKCTFSESFSDGLAKVKINDKFGFLDRTGKTVIPFDYEVVTTFSEGLASAQLNGKWGYLDRSGKVIIPFIFDGYSSRFSEGLAYAYTKGKGWSFIDKTGKEVISPTPYSSVNRFSGGLAAVRNGDAETGKWGYIDKTGKEVISLRYDSAHEFTGGLARVKLNKKWGLIDKTAREIVPIKYDSFWCIAFIDQGFIGVQLNGKKGFVDLYGNEYFDF